MTTSISSTTQHVADPRPILDRAIVHDTDLYDALKIGLISMDSTMRSNLGVGLPIDIVVLRRDAIQPAMS